MNEDINIEELLKLLEETNEIDDELLQLEITNRLLTYNSIIENDINKNGGTILYSYNNIIIASEISDELFNELQKNPNIEFIQSLPLKKYGNIDNSLINQFDIETL